MNDDNEQLHAAFDEWMAGKWKGCRAGELVIGMQMRDGAGNPVGITGVYPSANNCVFVEAVGRTGVHIPATKIVLIAPTT